MDGLPGTTTTTTTKPPPLHFTSIRPFSGLEGVQRGGASNTRPPPHEGRAQKTRTGEVYGKVTGSGEKMAYDF